MNYCEEIFKLLEIEPEAEFKLAETCNSTSGKVYKLTSSLVLLFRRQDEPETDFRPSCFNIRDILTGIVTIVNSPCISLSEQIAINYAKICKYKWIAKDADGKVNAFKTKPEKSSFNEESRWEGCGHRCYCSMPIEVPMSFLSWDDEEPYYIGD